MNDSIRKAMEIVESAREITERCHHRPIYHFTSPTNWMNDPNGTIFYKGEYHLFYQHNPYKNKWGSIHWGHAKSKDLVHWEHLPIALAPSRKDGEKHCFSGCCVIDNGIPKILYTKIGRIRDIFHGAEQWMAIGDDQLIKWERFPRNPVMDNAIHGKEKIRQWRDPYIWKEGDSWFCVLGGHYKLKRRGSIFLYKSEDLIQWEYLHPLYEGNKGQGWCFECPNFFPLGNKHVLIISPFGRVIYGIGSYRDLRFQPDSWKVLDHGRCFYATNTLIDEKGRLILFGWIKGGGKGWNGCMSLPRILSMNNEGQLGMRPLPELTILRKKLIKFENLSFKSSSEIMLESLSGSQLEFLIKFDNIKDDRFGFFIRKDKKSFYFGVDAQRGEIFAGKERGMVNNLKPISRMTLHAFIDGPLIELCVNEKEWITSRIQKREREKLEYHIFSRNREVNVDSLDTWILKSTWKG